MAAPHEGDFNTHRLCMTHSCEGDEPWKMELEINASDAWGISRVLGRVFAASGMEARQGGDGETRLHPKDDSPVPQGDAQTTPQSVRRDQ
jgi:hypothetical protein